LARFLCPGNKLGAVVVASALAVLTSQFLTPFEGAASAQPPPVQSESIVNVANSGSCLDAEYANYGVNGDPIQLWTCDGNDEQQFFLYGDEVLNWNNQCLAADVSNWPNNHDPIVLENCNSSLPEQKWELESDGVLENQSETSKCVDADSDSYPINGDVIQLYSCNPDANEQVWEQSDQYCTDTNQIWEYGEQFTAQQSGDWYGELGTYSTTTASVPDDSNDLELSHLYMQDYEGSPQEIEVGFYIGQGTPDESSPTWYYAYENSNSIYQETDISSPQPTIGNQYPYKIEYEGTTDGGTEGKWQVFWSTYSSSVFDIVGLFAGDPMAGGEIQTAVSGNPVGINSQGDSPFQLEDSSNTWDDWNTSLPGGTHSCGDPGVTYTDDSPWESFTVEGGINGG
jgi:hypothetical protein